MRFRENAGRSSRNLTAVSPFEELAGEHSDCPETRPAIWVFSRRGQMVRRFEEVGFSIWNRAPTADIFETEFGLHIAKVYEKRVPPMPCPLEQVREVIVPGTGRSRRKKKPSSSFWMRKKKRPSIEEAIKTFSSGYLKSMFHAYPYTIAVADNRFVIDPHQRDTCFQFSVIHFASWLVHPYPCLALRMTISRTGYRWSPTV